MDPQSDTTARFARSTGAATFSQLWRVGVMFVTQIVLMRLIAPPDWGLFEWTLALFMILGAVRDLGLVYHVVRVQPRPYGNLLAVELVWGGVLAAAAFAGVGVLALGFSESHESVAPVLRLFCLVLLLEGVAAVPKVYFDAELEVGRTVLPEILRNLTFAATAVVLALQGYGVWSLVVAQVACSFVYAAHLWLRAYKTMPLHWEAGATWELLRHSLPLATIWFLAILIQRIDPLILGTQFTRETVGLYTRAYFFAFLVRAILVPAVGRTLYPALVAYATNPPRLLEAYRLATLLVVAVEITGGYFLFLNAEAALRLVGGEVWVSAAPYLKVLALAPLIDPFTRLGGEVLKVYRRDRLWIVASALTLAAFVACGFAFTARWGAIGMAWANYLPLGGVLMTWGLYRIAPRPVRVLARDLLVVYLVPIPLFAITFVLAGDRIWLRFGLSAAAALIVLGFYARRFGAPFREFFRQV
ncbi:MAG: oligosaccharide flippase family protein [Acidobacteriota bacterium]|nr:oligosaccharide flippase family protein [Acidobacteriota bacterium]